MKKLFLLFIFLFSFTFPLEAQFYLWRYREHATDCTSLTDGKDKDLCYEIDSQTYWKCVYSSGTVCDTAGEWKQLQVAPNSITLGTDTTGNYVATIADSGNSTITVAGSGSENASVTLEVIDVNCTGCLGSTEIAINAIGADELSSTAIQSGDIESGDLPADGYASTYLNDDGDTGSGTYNFTGNVGIGSATPSEVLDVVGNIKATKWISLQGNLGLDLTDDGSDLILHADTGGTNSFIIDTDGAFFELVANPGPSNNYLLATITETQGSETELNFYEGGTGHNRFWNSGSARFGGASSYLCSQLTSDVDCDVSSTGADIVVQDDIWAGGALFVNDASSSSWFKGNVGIGSTIPQSPLDVVGNINISGTVVTGALGANVTASTASSDDNDTSVATTAFVQQEINGAGGTNLSCSSGQCNVDDVFLLNNADDTTSGVITAGGIIVGDTDCVGLDCSAKGRISFDDDTTDYVNILSANVGIGTSIPQNVLHVVGGIDSDTLNTGQGDYELYSMDQNVTTTSTPTFSTVTVDTEVYDASGWDADNTVPTKDAVRDKIESLGSGGAFTDGGTVVYLTGDQTDNVGIGTTNPTATLELIDKGSDIFQISSAAEQDGDYLVVDTSGNIGIGSTVPEVKFHMKGTNVQMFLDDDGDATNPLLMMGSENGFYYSAPAGAIYYSYNNAQVGGFGTKGVEVKDGGVNDPSYGFFNDTSNNTGMFLAGEDILGFTAGGNPGSMWIAGQNVGIHESSPEAGLEISEEGVTPFMISNGDAGDGDFFIVNTSGNVGIGSANPAHILDVAGTSFQLGDTGQANVNYYLRAADTSNIMLNFGGASDDNEGQIMYRPHENAFYFTAGASTIGYWDSSVGLGIGTTGPAMQLHITGDMKMGTGTHASDVGTTLLLDGTTDNAIIFNNDGGTGDDHFIQFRDNDTAKATFWYDTSSAYTWLETGAASGDDGLALTDVGNLYLVSNVGIGSSIPQDELDISGDSRVSGVYRGGQFTRCLNIEDLTASDDNMSMGSFTNAVTIGAVWCHYSGSGSTVGQISLEDGSGNAMTHTIPTCTVLGTTPTAQSVTSGNTLTAKEILAFDVDNTPSPTTDDYTICVEYSVD